jgi:hypothetical protein
MPKGISVDNGALGSIRGEDLRCSELARPARGGRGPVLICEVCDARASPRLEDVGRFAPMAGLSPGDWCFEPVSLAMLPATLVDDKEGCRCLRVENQGKESPAVMKWSGQDKEPEHWSLERIRQQGTTRRTELKEGPIAKNRKLASSTSLGDLYGTPLTGDHKQARNCKWLPKGARDNREHP